MGQDAITDDTFECQPLSVGIIPRDTDRRRGARETGNADGHEVLTVSPRRAAGQGERGELVVVI
jgi:hypothetical protein